jgi:tRNA (guanine-N7-)-methyltransferase
MTEVISAIYRPTNWLDPLDWQQVFPEVRAIEVDVGCGKGGFLLWAARSRSQFNFIGIERQLVRVRKVEKRIQRAGLANVRLLRVEASYCIGKLVPNDSIAAYHVYFPDPWPKRRHHQRRLFQQEFVSDLHRTLRKGGAVNVATDDEKYSMWIEKVMWLGGGFSRTGPEPLPPEAMTEFERIFDAAGEQIFRARYTRRD